MRILNDQNYSKEESKTYKMPENFEATISIHVNFTMKRAVRIILLSPKATLSSQMQDKTNSTLGNCAARIKVSKRLQVARNSFDWTTMALEAIGFPAGISPGEREIVCKSRGRRIRLGRMAEDFPANPRSPLIPNRLTVTSLMANYACRGLCNTERALPPGNRTVHRVCSLRANFPPLISPSHLSSSKLSYSNVKYIPWYRNIL